MQTKKVSNFINTCYRCFKKIEYPLLGNLSYGELLLQTEDGQDFYYVDLMANKTFEFVCQVINAYNNFKNIDPQKVLILLADKKNDKAFAVDYPICPNCQRKQKHFNDNIPGTIRIVEYATWQYFEELAEAEKMICINEICRRLV